MIFSCDVYFCRFSGEPIGITPFENAAAAFLFFCFVLSIGATYFAVKAIEEIRYAFI